jgi:hypothetical protein
VKRCHGNREFPIGDFPIATGVWGPSVSNEDRCHRRIDTSGLRRLKFQLVDIASSDFPIGRTPIERGRSQRLTPSGFGESFTGIMLDLVPNNNGSHIMQKRGLNR